VTEISENFDLDEFAVSGSYPHLVEPVPEEFIPNVKRMVKDILQPIRTMWGRSFEVLSCYRSKKLNKAVKGSETSQHRSAAAVDFTTADIEALFLKLLSEPNKYPCGQVIGYPKKGFIHIALPGRRYPVPTFFINTGGKKYVLVKNVTQASKLWNG
jgi:zinc D-Ala-D-Ala carboxypeptidase